MYHVCSHRQGAGKSSEPAVVTWIDRARFPAFNSDNWRFRALAPAGQSRATIPPLCEEPISARGCVLSRRRAAPIDFAISSSSCEVIHRERVHPSQARVSARSKACAGSPVVSVVALSVHDGEPARARCATTNFASQQTRVMCSDAIHLFAAPEWSTIQVEMVIMRLVVVWAQDYVEIAAGTVVRGP